MILYVCPQSALVLLFSLDRVLAEEIYALSFMKQYFLLLILKFLLTVKQSRATGINGYILKAVPCGLLVQLYDTDDCVITLLVRISGCQDVNLKP